MGSQPPTYSNKVALSVQVNMKNDLREVYLAQPAARAAEVAINVFADRCNAKHDKAVACLTEGPGQRLLALLATSPPSTGTTLRTDESFSRACLSDSPASGR